MRRTPHSPREFRSFLLATAVAPELANLPPEVVQAITYHDGGYGRAKYDLTGGERALMIALHAADMMSSRFEGSWPIDPITTLEARLLA